jgi:hypothetical protein
MFVCFESLFVWSAVSPVSSAGTVLASRQVRDLTEATHPLAGEDSLANAKRHPSPSAGDRALHGLSSFEVGQSRTRATLRDGPPLRGVDGLR